MVEDKERADADAAGCAEGGASVEAVGAALKDDAVGGVVGVVAGVGEFVDGVAEDGGLAGQAAEGEFVGFDAEAGAQPDAVGADQGDGGDWGVAELRGQTGDVIEDGIGRGIEDLILIEGFNPQSFVFDQESIHLTSIMVGICKLLRTPTFVAAMTYGFGRTQHSAVAGGSLALASRATFQVPSASFLQTVRYRPVAMTGSPFLSRERPS
jgi:hypothetical protein